MNRREQDQRDTKIALARSLGAGQDAVAKAFDVSTKTVSRAERRIRESGILKGGNPEALLEEYLLRLDQSSNDLALLRPTLSPSARVAAIRAYVEILEDKIELLRCVGLLPPVYEDHLEYRERFAAELRDRIRSEARADRLPGETVEWYWEVIQDWLENGDKSTIPARSDTFERKGVPLPAS